MPGHWTEDAIGRAAKSIVGVAESMEQDGVNPTSRLMRLIGPSFIEWMLREQSNGTNNGGIMLAAGQVIGFLTAYIIHQCPNEQKQHALDEMSDITADMLNHTLKVLDSSTEVMSADPGGHG
jgi:hypothetical protein